MPVTSTSARVRDVLEVSQFKAIGERYSELAGSWADGGEPFTREMDVRLYSMTPLGVRDTLETTSWTSLALLPLPWGRRA